MGVQVSQTLARRSHEVMPAHRVERVAGELPVELRWQIRRAPQGRASDGERLAS